MKNIILKRVICLLIPLSMVNSNIWATSCTGTPPQGTMCDETTHRWVMTKSDIELDLSAKSCESEEFLTNNNFANREECFNQLAINRFYKDYGFKDSDSKNILKIVQFTGIAAIFSLAVLSKTGGLFKGTCSPAMGLLAGGAAANATGDIWAWIKHNKKAKEIADDYEEYAKNQDTESAQKKAFDFLAAEQDVIADTAKIRGRGQTAAALLYSAASVAALIEVGTNITPAMKAKKAACEVKEKASGADFLMSKTAVLIASAAGLITTTTNFWQDKKQKGGSELEEQNVKDIKSGFLQRERQAIQFALVWTATLWLDTLIPSAHANPLSGILASVKSVETTELSTAIVQAGVATSMAVVTSLLAKHSFHIAKLSEERAINLRKLASNFQVLNTSCSDDEKSGAVKPIKIECYCYSWNSDKQKYLPRSTDRSNSDLCRQSWNGNDPKFFPYNDYTNDPLLSGRGCVNINGQYDQTCDCRNLKGSNGQNACAKVTLNRGNGGLKFNQINGMEDSLTSVQKYLNGNLSAGALNPAQLNQSLARSLRAAKKVEEAINKKLAAGSAPLNLAALQNKQFKNLAAKSVKPISSSSTSNSSNKLASTLSKKDLDEISEAAKNAGISLSGPQYNQIGQEVKGEEKKDDFDFGMGEASQSQTGNRVENIMDKNFNYGENDIIKRKEQSIFKILSNRYISSGLKRLFEE